MANPAGFPAKAANKAVVVVPILAPTVTGNTERKLSSPDPAIGTNSEVVIELDWTAIVSKVPNKMDK